MTPADRLLAGMKGLHGAAIDLSLDRLRRLLAALGHPERRLPPVIHVAGTNGKGSTVAFLRAMLEGAGAAVHGYTSPHILRASETLVLGTRSGSAPVAEAVLADALARVLAANAGRALTPFEALTAAAFLACSERPADALLLEVGMGGRDDATNVVADSVAAVITRISMDHREFLGDTPAAIAHAKAGIVKPGRPVILQPQPDPEVRAVVAAEAARRGAPLHEGGVGWRAEATADGFRYASAERTLDLPRPALVGDHQLLNAGTAIAALERAPGLAPRDPLEPARLAGALRRVSWPGRLQRLTDGPLCGMLPAGWELWLDGGHNDSAGEVLGAQAAAWADARPRRPLRLVVGMLDGKDAAAFLAPLARHAESLRAVPVPTGAYGRGPIAPEALAAVGRSLGIARVAACGSVAEALADLARGADAGEAARVLVCGSLHLVCPLAGPDGEGGA